jgi:hypothetical protein
MKIIIAGGRDYKDYDGLLSISNRILANVNNIEIVHGGQSTYDDINKVRYGADYLAERYAQEMGFQMTVFNADWDKHGKRAGVLRNKEMARYGEALIAFWDGESKGTKNMIAEAKKLELPVRVIKYKQEPI